MTEAAQTAIGKRLDARYTLLDKLGAGGQGEVWRAHDDVRDVDVALKVLRASGRTDAWRTLQHEYEIASRLDHPSILKVYPPERAGDALVLPMELAPGGDLRRLRGAGFLEIVPALLELANALEHAHERGVVHRDLKPGNVLFDARGRACLADFGVAETAQSPGTEKDGGNGSAGASRDTNRHGFSPFTASPAQLRGEPPTPADDIYGLGALAYELLSGYPPYYPHFDKQRAMEERVPMLVPTRQIPPLLGTLVMHMLAKDPRKRPRSMRAVIDELDATLNDTLTYDFENVSPSTPHASVAMSAAGRTDGADSAREQPPGWEPGDRDRRSRADRRGRRSEDLGPPSSAQAAAQPTAEGENRSRPGHRSGAEALARIDAALERAAAEASVRPKTATAAAPAADTVIDAPRRFQTMQPAPKPTPPAPPAPTPRATPTVARPAGATSSSEPEDDSIVPPVVPEGRPESNVASAVALAAASMSSASGAPAASSGATSAFVSPPVPGKPTSPEGIPARMTPAEAAAIVAAARAAARQAEQRTAAPVSNDTVPQLPDTMTTARSARPATSAPVATPIPAPPPAPGPAAEVLPPRSARSKWPLEGNPTLPGLPDAPTSSQPTSTASVFDHPSMSEDTMVLPPLEMGTYASVLDDPPDEPAATRLTAPPAAPVAEKAAAPEVASTPKRVASEAPASAKLVPPAPPAAEKAAAPAVPSTPKWVAPEVPGSAKLEPPAAPVREKLVPPTPQTVAHVPLAPLPAPQAPPQVQRLESEHPVTVEEYVFSPAYPDSGRRLRAEPTIGSDGGPGRQGVWADIPVASLPKVARLEPEPPPLRWPWIAAGLLVGAAAVVYFLLPHFDTESWPPQVSAVVDPIKAAIATAGSDSSNASLQGSPAGPGAIPSDDASVATSGNGGATAPAVASAAAAQSGVGPKAGVGSAVGAAGAAANPGVGRGGVVSAAVAGASAATSATSTADLQRLRDMRASFDTRLAALDARGAGVWGGRDFATAKSRAAESIGARDAGNVGMALERLTAAVKLLDSIESRAPQAYAEQLATGEKALVAGQQEVASQAFALAHRINPADRRATDGQKRAQNLTAVLPLLADARNAETDHDYARAAQDFSQALSLDPTNAAAKAGQARTNAAFGDDSYARAVGSGFAALGAGKLDDAHEAFVKARALKPNGSEAAEGLRRVGAALTARGFASMRQRALGLEAQERWSEAERTYEDVLAADASLAFAQEGKARTNSRADLSSRLQQYLDRPDRLSAPGVRDDARSLLATARAQSPQGPMIRSQIARLETLLPGFERPVRLSLVSDNSTRVEISTVGSFGSFAHRDIELRPGRYLLVGTRNGFRDVRREITVVPGQQAQIIRVTCSEPI